MKIFNWECTSFLQDIVYKTLETDLETCFIGLTTFCIRNLRLKDDEIDKNSLHYYYGDYMTPMQANINN